MARLLGRNPVGPVALSEAEKDPVGKTADERAARNLDSLSFRISDLSILSQLRELFLNVLISFQNPNEARNNLPNFPKPFHKIRVQRAPVENSTRDHDSGVSHGPKSLYFGLTTRVWAQKMRNFTFNEIYKTKLLYRPPLWSRSPKYVR